MKIAIIIGSVREKRHTEAVAGYLFDIAAKRAGEATYELVDLREFNVPLLSTSVHPMAANKHYPEPRVQKWSELIDSFDGYVFVTPEYNHGVPGAFKNAVDVLGAEWVGKPIAFVGHGSVGGVRAIEQWRQIMSNFSMPLVRAEINFNSFYHWKDGAFAPEERHSKEANSMFHALEELVAKHCAE